MSITQLTTATAALALLLMTGACADGTSAYGPGAASTGANEAPHNAAMASHFESGQSAAQVQAVNPTAP